MSPLLFFSLFNIELLALNVAVTESVIIWYCCLSSLAYNSWAVNESGVSDTTAYT